MSKEYKLELQLECESEVYRKNEIYHVMVNSIEEAVEVYQDSRDTDFFTKNGMVGSNDYQYADTGSLKINGEVIARISYNGKVWKEENSSDKKDLFGSTQIKEKDFHAFLSEIIAKKENEDKMKKITIDKKDVDALESISIALYDQMAYFVANDYNLTEKVNKIWIDMGNSVYGLHIEIKFDNEETADLYFSPINGNLRMGLNGTETKKMLESAPLSLMISEELADKLFEIVKERAKQGLIEELKEYSIPDTFFFNGDVYTMENYDSDGKELVYGSKEGNNRIIVETIDRYKSKEDLKITELEFSAPFEGITYMTRDEYLSELQIIQRVKDTNKQKRENNKNKEIGADKNPAL